MIAVPSIFPARTRVAIWLTRIVLSKWFLPACFLLAAFLRTAWVLLNMDILPVSDEYDYFTGGVQLARGEAFRINYRGGDAAGMLAVGWSALLSLIFRLFGVSVAAAQFANVLMSMGILFLFYAVALRLFKSRAVARIGLLMMSVFPEQVFYPPLLVTDVALLFTLMLGIFTLSRYGIYTVAGAMLSGFVFALCCHIKPQYIFVPAVYLLACAAASRLSVRIALGNVSVLYAALLIGLLPWTIRNIKTARATIFTGGYAGVNLFIGNNPKATGTYEGEQIITPDGTKPGKYAVRYIMKHPLRVLKLWPKKFYYLYLAPEDGPLHALTLSKFPDRLPEAESHRVVEGIRNENDKALFLAGFDHNETTGEFVLKPHQPIEARAKLADIMLHTFRYDYPTPRGHIKGRLILNASRHVVEIMFLLYLVGIAVSKNWRAELFEGGHAVAGLMTIGCLTLIYLVFYASQRYSFVIMPFIIIYAATFLSRLLVVSPHKVSHDG